MTGSKKINVAGAEVTITANVYVRTVDVLITLDLSPLDTEEPDHSPHQLINYLELPHYKTRDASWWCCTYYKATCRTGSQAARIIKRQTARIDDAVNAAILARNSRKAELDIAMR